MSPRDRKAQLKTAEAQRAGYGCRRLVTAGAGADVSLNRMQAFCLYPPDARPPWGGHVDAGAAAEHHRAGHASGRSPGDHAHASRRRSHWRPHRGRHHSPVSRPASHDLRCGADRGWTRAVPGEVSLAHNRVRGLEARPACRRHVLSAASSTAAQFLLEDTTAVLISCARSVRTSSIDAS
jgi:hypothetical protein